MKKEIIYLRVPVHIEYNHADARKHVIEALTTYDRPWKCVMGGGIGGLWAYETKQRPKLMRKPKAKK